MEIRNLKKTYGEKTICESLNLSIPDKGLVTVLGKSGSGKTTLVHMIAGLVKPDAGEIIFGRENPKISMVFQEDRLLEGATVLENALIAESGSRNVKEILDELGLENEKCKKAGELSGGMARRTAIARCLAREADIYIMDEPIKGLDKETAVKVINTILKYTGDALLIVVTHNQNEFASPDMEIIIE